MGYSILFALSGSLQPLELRMILGKSSFSFSISYILLRFPGRVYLSVPHTGLLSL